MSNKRKVSGDTLAALMDAMQHGGPPATVTEIADASGVIAPPAAAPLPSLEEIDLGVAEPDADDPAIVIANLEQQVGLVTEMPGTIAELTAAASSSSDYLKVLSRIHADQQVAEAEHARLEAGRATIILDGRDVGEYHQALFVAKQTLLSLKAAEDEVRRRHDDALTREARQVLEGEVAEAAEVHAPAYQQSLVRFHTAMSEVIAAAQEVDTHAEAIEATNQHSARASRPELKVDLRRLRRAVVQQLGGELASATVLERREGESDEAFDIRSGNAVQQALDVEKRTDPLRLAGEAAASAIEEFAFDMDSHERARNRRMVSVKTYRGYGGQPVREIKDVLVDGRPANGAPHNPQVGPYGKQGERKVPGLAAEGISRGVAQTTA